jgi:hypothetical protein
MSWKSLLRSSWKCWTVWCSSRWDTFPRRERILQFRWITNCYFSPASLKTTTQRRLNWRSSAACRESSRWWDRLGIRFSWVPLSLGYLWISGWECRYLLRLRLPSVDHRSILPLLSLGYCPKAGIILNFHNVTASVSSPRVGRDF